MILRDLLGAVLLLCYSDPAYAQQMPGTDTDDEFVPAEGLAGASVGQRLV